MRPLVRPRAKRFVLAFELGQGAGQLLPSGDVCGRFELPAEFRVGQAQRFGAPQLFRIVVSLGHRAPRALFFTFVHPLLDAILCVD